MAKTYRINEIFHSVQGEGAMTGRAAAFIRMAGCNRACPFCDTDHTAFTEMTAADILDTIEPWPTRYAVVTGGEPLLQLDATLIDALHSRGWTVAIETNGTIPVPEGVDWVACSPKARPWADLARIDELKVVMTDDVAPEAVASAFPQARQLFLQPCHDAATGTANTAETVEYVKSHPRWRLSLQTHRLIGVR